MNSFSGLITIGTFVAILVLPWPAAAILALAGALWEPLLPLAGGIFFDALYYSPTHGLPLATILGAVVAFAAWFVRRRVKASIIGR